MKKVLLTSCGFETKSLEDAFLSLLDKAPDTAKVLFVPTAAVYPDAIMVLPKCMNDLLKVGIPKDNITVYDMHRVLSLDELMSFDAVYFTGGDPSYLLNRINGIGFAEPLKKYIASGGVFVGVSAGSLIAAGNMPNNLGLIGNEIYVHMPEGTPCGEIPCKSGIALSSTNAILIRGEKIEVIE